VPSGYREFLTPAHTFWSGALPETDFLARLYNLEELPSTDSRYTTAFRDIVQHRVMNEDWDDDWIFHDSRFGLVDSDEALLKFLAEMLHPAVRTDPIEVERLRNSLNGVLIHDGYELVQVDDISGAPLFAPRRIGTGVRGTMKNLIFAAIGPKPEIVLIDAVNNDLRITGNVQGCLMYDRPLAAHGLTWAELTVWWADREGMVGAPARQVSSSLYRRLDRSLGENDAERRVLRTYADRYLRLGPDIPALVPQVYLHYDPHVRSHYPPGAAPLSRQRMDFLMLLPHRARVVIECDGVQHYADDQRLPNSRRYANPHRYAEMVAEDRELRLAGYEVYRFGGAELVDGPDTERRLNDFFDRLAERHAA
jgi:very-short-patch-repair endonuclease